VTLGKAAIPLAALALVAALTGCSMPVAGGTAAEATVPPSSSVPAATPSTAPALVAPELADIDKDLGDAGGALGQANSDVSAGNSSASAGDTP
jgi:hypothetical protein